jgi:hypothetical protein
MRSRISIIIGRLTQIVGAVAIVGQIGELAIPRTQSRIVVPDPGGNLARGD